MFGELISAGAGLLGGLFGKSSQEKANRQNIEFQKKFAQKGIQWRVADAKAAGIHPLAALGASTASFSPSVVGDTSLGSAIGQAGQDLGRAFNATRTSDQKLGDLQLQIAQEQLKGLRLDNGGKAISNASAASQAVRNAQVGPPFPSVSGSGNTAIPGQASSKLRLGASAPLPSFPGSTSSDMGNAFGELIEDFAGAVNFRDSMSKMSANQKLGLLQAVFPGFQWSAMQLGRKYRPPADYGPRVTTKSFQDTFQ